MELSQIDVVLLVISAVLFFIAGIAPHVGPANPPPINWVAWGLFLMVVAFLPFF